MSDLFLTRQWRARPAACAGLSVLLGMICCNRLLAFPVYLAVIAAAFFAVGIFLSVRKFRYGYLAILLAFFLFGGVRLQCVIDAHAPVEEVSDAEITGTVNSDPEYRADAGRIVCRFKVASVNGKPADTEVRLYLRSDTMPLEGISYGQQLTYTGSLWPQDSASNEYQFDSRKWLLSDGLCGMSAAKLEDVTVTGTTADFNTCVYRFRACVSSLIDRLFPENPALVKAFVLGTKAELSQDLKDDFSDSGVAHLICVSGMHISVLAMAVSMLLGKRLPRNLSICLTIALVMLYGLMIGFPVSLTRAAVMFAILSAAPMFGRNSDPYTRLLLTLGTMLLIDPLNLYRSGFALSFGASAGILLLNEPLSALFQIGRLKAFKKKDAPKPLKPVLGMVIYLAELVSVSLSAQMGTLPFVIRTYGAQSALTLFTNLFAVPLAMVAYPMALAAVCLSGIFFYAGVPLAFASDKLFSLLVFFIHSMTELPSMRLRIPVFPDWLTLLYYALLLAVSSISVIPIAIRKWGTLSAALCVGVSILLAAQNGLGCRLILFSQEDACSSLLRCDGKNYLIGVGDAYTPAADYLSAVCRSLDALFLYDGETGGLDEVLEVMKPDVIYTFGEDPTGSGVTELALQPGDSLRLSDRLTVTATESGLRFVYDGTSILYAENAETDTDIVVSGENLFVYRENTGYSTDLFGMITLDIGKDQSCTVHTFRERS